MLILTYLAELWKVDSNQLAAEPPEIDPVRGMSRAPGVDWRLLGGVSPGRRPAAVSGTKVHPVSSTASLAGQHMLISCLAKPCRFAPFHGPRAVAQLVESRSPKPVVGVRVPPALQSSYLWLLYDDDARSELRAEVSVSDDDKTPELESDDSQTESPRAIARAERKAEREAQKAEYKADKLAKKELKKQQKADGTYKGVFKRMALFFRQVVAELRKVIWPTRKDAELHLDRAHFVLIMGAYIGVLDFIFTKGSAVRLRIDDERILDLHHEQETDERGLKCPITCQTTTSWLLMQTLRSKMLPTR